MTQDFDLIVVGGGPAGTSAAITAAREGSRVLLLERGRVPRHKVCGEFVSAESLDLLAWLLGSGGEALTRQAIRVRETRLFLDGHTFNIPVDPPSASISRHDLDLALWNTATQTGVTTRAETTVQEIKSEGPFHVSTTAGEFSARALINASGRWSNLNRGQNGGKGSRWLGIKAHCRGEMDPAVELYFFDGGYCGVQPVRTSDGTPMINVCALLRPGIADNVDTLLRCHPLLESCSRTWKPAFPALRTFPVEFRQPTPVSGFIPNAGDAANFVDPFVGDGIAIALWSGYLAAKNLVPYLRGEQSMEGATREYAREYRSSLASVYRASSVLRKFLRIPGPLRAPLLFACERSPRLAEYLLKSTRSRAAIRCALAV